MKNINLLPKVPLIRRILLPALLAIVMIGIAINAALSLFQLRLKDELQVKQVEKTQLESSIPALTTEKTMDARSKDYIQLKTELEKLTKLRRDWLPVFQAITSNLPKTTRLLSVDTASTVPAVPGTAQAPAASAASAAGEKVTVKLESAVFTDSAEYITSLMTSPVVDKVNVLEVVRSKWEGSPLPQGLPVEHQATQQLLPGQLNQPVTGAEGEQLLNQLQSMIAGVSNAVSNGASNGISSVGSNAGKSQSAPSPNQTQQTQESAGAAPASGGADASRAVYKYSISLEITLKPLEVSRK